MRRIFLHGLVPVIIRECSESSELEKPIRRIRRIRGQAISQFGSGYAGLGFPVLSHPFPRTVSPDTV
jgi:hypothetical protein